MLPSKPEGMTGSLLEVVVLTQSRTCKEAVYAACYSWNWKVGGVGKHREKEDREALLSNVSCW